ncbi:tetratricopeptide repeat protein [Luteolibacter sp. Y139]|uniref:Tetratricopeptide repeat protein n=2 Tax=Luteolibacter soli TaxID=3135280 RepID=A0ABU9AQD0_9BACT
MFCPIVRIAGTGLFLWVGVGFAQEGTPEAPAPAANPAVTAPASPVSADAWVRLGDLQMQRARNTVQHDFTAASNAYTKALALDPNDGRARLGMAWVKNSEHDFAAGKEWAEKALEIDPKLQDAYSLMGDGAMELGDYEGALKYFQKALDLSADLASYSRAAHLMWLTGQSGRARLMMQRAIDAGGPFPENTAWCRAELATMHLQDGATLAAEKQIEIALKEAPRNPRVLAAQGRILAAKSDWSGAIAAYRQSVEVTPTHDALAALADLYFVTGDIEAAKSAVDRVIAFHADHAHMHDGTAHVHGPGNAQLALFLADHDRAIDLALVEGEAACKAFPNIGSFDALAWCQFKKGNHEAAREAMRKAMAWHTPDPLLYFHMGMIEAALGDTRGARSDLSRALQLNPRFHPRHAPEAVEKLASLVTVPEPVAQLPAAAAAESP